MGRFIHIAAALFAFTAAGCVQTSQRNVIPNAPGERSSRFGGAIRTTAGEVPIPGLVYTGAIGIPGEAEVGFSSDNAYITKLITRDGDFALSSSLDFGLGRTVGFVASDDDGTFFAEFRPKLGHQFLVQLGDNGQTRASLGSQVQYNSALVGSGPQYLSGPVGGALFMEVGKAYPDGLYFSARVSHSEGLVSTSEFTRLSRGTHFTVALSWD